MLQKLGDKVPVHRKIVIAGVVASMNLDFPVIVEESLDTRHAAIIQRLEYEYPFGLNKNRIRISDTIKDYFGKLLNNAELSYNDILCIYPELLENYKEEKMVEAR